MAAVKTIGQLRSALGGLADAYSDEELLGAVAASTGEPIEQAAVKYGYDTAKGPWSERGSAAVDSYQASLYGVGEAAAGAAGATGVQDFMSRRRRANQISAGISGTRAKQGGIPDDWREVDGVGSAARYVGGLALDSAPYIAEAAVGGIAGRAVAAGLKVGAAGLRAGATAEELASRAHALNGASMLGGAVASYPSSVGDILGNQREQNDTTNLGTAAALGVPYAALNGMFGLESIAARAKLPQMISPVMDNIAGVKGRIARAGATGVQTAITEGASETGQEFMNQLGRMSVDERATFMSEEAKKRYVDSFVGGAALGLVFGAGGSGGRRSEHYRGPQSPMDATTTDPTAAPQSQDMLALPYDPSVGSALNGVVNPNPAFAFPRGGVALSEDQLVQHATAPQAATDLLALPYDPNAGQAEQAPLYGVKRGVALNEDQAFAARFAPQPGEASEPTVRLYRAESPTANFDDTFDRNGLTDFASDKPGTRFTSDPNYAEYFRRSYGPDAVIRHIDVPQSVANAGRINDYEFKIQEKPTAPAATVIGKTTTPNPAATSPEMSIPIAPGQDVGTPASASASDQTQAQPPVQHSGTPEAIARIEETQQRKVAATDAIARAQEAGMVSEKQQSLFWRAEELAKEGKLSDSKMTQVTALLMQSKFGVVKTTLDEAAAGAPDANGQAIVKHVTRTLEQIDKEIAKAREERASLLSPKPKGEKRIPAKETLAQVRDAEKNIAALQKERDSVVAHGAKQAGTPMAAVDAAATPVTAPAATPQTAEPVAPAQAAATPTITESQAPAQEKPVSKLRAKAERANKIRRYELFLACLGR